MRLQLEGSWWSNVRECCLQDLGKMDEQDLTLSFFFFVSKRLLNGRKTYRCRFDRLVKLIILTLPASEHRDRGAAGIISRLLRAGLWNSIPVHEYFCRLRSNPFYTFLSGMIVRRLKWQTADLILSGALVTETGNERCQSPLSPLSRMAESHHAVWFHAGFSCHRSAFTEVIPPLAESLNLNAALVSRFGMYSALGRLCAGYSCINKTRSSRGCYCMW